MTEERFAGSIGLARSTRSASLTSAAGSWEGRRYRHNEPGIRALCARLLRLGVALVALERPDGLLIERLLDAGLAVVAVHPNQVKASRPRYSVAGGEVADGLEAPRRPSSLARQPSLFGAGTQYEFSVTQMTRARGRRAPGWAGGRTAPISSIAGAVPGRASSVGSPDSAGVPRAATPPPRCPRCR